MKLRDIGKIAFALGISNLLIMMMGVGTFAERVFSLKHSERFQMHIFSPLRFAARLMGKAGL